VPLLVCYLLFSLPHHKFYHAALSRANLFHYCGRPTKKKFLCWMLKVKEKIEVEVVCNGIVSKKVFKDFSCVQQIENFLGKSSIINANIFLMPTYANVSITITKLMKI
jgi:hypothetical protein